MATTQWTSSPTRIRALSESALYVGSEIEYAKLSIVVGLALAAAEISYSLSMSGPTGGASLAWIPPIEMLTIGGLSAMGGAGNRTRRHHAEQPAGQNDGVSRSAPRKPARAGHLGNPREDRSRPSG